MAAELAEREEFDRDAALRRLFTLPLPTIPSYRRSYPIDTPLGRIMRLRGMQVRDVTKHPNTPNDRQMTELLAGRAEIGRWRVGLAIALKVDARLL